MLAVRSLWPPFLLHLPNDIFSLCLILRNDWNSSDGSMHLHNFNPKVFGRVITETSISVNQVSSSSTNYLKYLPVPSTAGNYCRGHWLSVNWSTEHFSNFPMVTQMAKGEHGNPNSQSSTNTEATFLLHRSWKGKFLKCERDWYGATRTRKEKIPAIRKIPQQ